MPLIPGYDVAGVVEKVGGGITKMKVGDAVYAYVLFGGGSARYAVATEDEAALKPKSLTFVQAAAVPLAALTAWQALVDVAKISAGPNVTSFMVARAASVFRGTDCESAWRESDRDRVDGKSGFTQATRRGRGD